MIRNKPFENQTNGLVYLVASPIGNLNDFSFRAVETLKNCDIIACEDTRNTSILLKHYNITNKNIVSLYSQTEQEESIKLIEKIKNNNLTLCYLSDAGMPGISDPGCLLVKNCIENDVSVSFIPGPTASLTSLTMSGFDTSSFSFHGFLSPKESQAINYLTKLNKNKETLIFYETSRRLKDFLSYLYKALGDRNICICKEVTKIHEEYIRGNLSSLINDDLSFIKGELVIIVEGNKEKEFDNSEKIKETILILKQENVSNKSILKILTSLFGPNKNFYYSLINKE